MNATYNSSTKTYTFNSDLVVTGNLTLKSSGTGAFPTGTTFNFKSLYVRGDLSLGTGTWSTQTSTNDTWTPTTASGQVTVNSTALYVRGNFTIGGATSSFTDKLGPICVEKDPNRSVTSDPSGSCYWSGTTSVDTTCTYTYTDSTTKLPVTVTGPAPVWVGFRLKVSGTYADVLGPTWANGLNDTNNTVTFAGPSSAPRLLAHVPPPVHD